MSAPAPAVPEAPPVAPPAAPTPPAPATAPPAAPAKPSLEDSLAPLDEATRTYVLGELAKARREAGDARTAAKTEAADAARQELAQAVGRAAGLIKDDEAADPAKLTEQLTATALEARAAKTDLAVYHAASGLGADAARLLDSVSFKAKLAAIDPTDGAAITAVIAEAVTADPTLVKTRLPAPNPAFGSSGGGAAPDIDAQIAEATRTGNHRLAISLKRQAQVLRNGT